MPGRGLRIGAEWRRRRIYGPFVNFFSCLIFISLRTSVSSHLLISIGYLYRFPPRLTIAISRREYGSRFVSTPIHILPFLINLPSLYQKNGEYRMLLALFFIIDFVSLLDPDTRYRPNELPYMSVSPDMFACVLPFRVIPRFA
jgi:hypothetical protein